MTIQSTEWVSLNRAVNALAELSAEGREYLLDRFWSDAEIIAEGKRRYQKRANEMELQKLNRGRE